MLCTIIVPTSYMVLKCGSMWLINLPKIVRLTQWQGEDINPNTMMPPLMHFTMTLLAQATIWNLFVDTRAPFLCFRHWNTMGILILLKTSFIMFPIITFKDHFIKISHISNDIWRERLNINIYNCPFEIRCFRN